MRTERQLPNGRMFFPLKGFCIAGAVVVFLSVIGFPEWVALLISFLVFLRIGGLLYLKLVYRTLPRDFRLLKTYYRVNKDIKNVEKENLYISDHFNVTVSKYPKKVAILFEDRKMTFKELDKLSNKIANFLQTSTNLQHGDCMALFMENCPEFIAVYLALSKIGVTGAFINHNLRGKCLAHCIHISHCSGVFFSNTLSKAVSEVLPLLVPPSMSQMLYSVGGTRSFSEAKILANVIKMASPATLPPVRGKSADDLVCYIYTSGTTGLPKACHIKHSRFFALQNNLFIFSKLCHEDVIYSPLPLYHSNAGVLSVGQMLFSGLTIVIRKRFSARNFWKDCIKYQCTVFLHIGELCRYLLFQPNHPMETQHPIRLMIGNGLNEQIWLKFIERFRIPQIIEFYGSIEGSVNLINPFNKVGACGCISVIIPFLNPVVLVKLNQISKEYVKDSRGFCIRAGINEPGGLIRRIKPNTATTHFDGYSDAETSHKKVMTDVFAKGDKYFLSGDIFRMDEEGYLYFCDRIEDTFRWKGENVSTTEVESIIANLLQLKDVVVYGVEVPGNEGRAGMAAIEGTKDSVNLSSLAQQLFLSLPAYALPLFVRLVPSAELTGTLKLKKVKLKCESFKITLPDPLFMLDTSKKTYQPLTEELYHQIQEGKLVL